MSLVKVTQIYTATEWTYAILAFSVLHYVNILEKGKMMQIWVRLGKKVDFSGFTALKHSEAPLTTTY